MTPLVGTSAVPNLDTRSRTTLAAKPIRVSWRELTTETVPENRQPEMDWEQLVKKIDQLVPGFKDEFENDLYLEEVKKVLAEEKDTELISWEQLKRDLGI